MTSLRQNAALALTAMLMACTAEGNARQRLASTGSSRPVQPTASGAASAERVWKATNVQDIYDVSPDGKLVGYIDWDTGNLMVHDLTTGADRDVTKKGSYADSRDEAEGALFSPDGRQIAYEWWDSKTRTDELRIVNVDGSGVKTLSRHESVWPSAWTRDGKAILTLLENPKSRDVALVPVSGGTPRVIKSFGPDNRQIRTTLSPDAKFIAVTVHAADMRRDIAILNAADGRELATLRHPAEDYPLTWTNDGLVLVSDRSGSPGLWLQPFTAGRTNGEPRQLRANFWGMSNAFVVDGGRLFYRVEAGDRDVYTASFDAANGRFSSQPVATSLKPGEDYSGVQFSPDDKYVAFFRREHTGVGFTKIAIRSTVTDEIREFIPPIFGPSRLTWIPGSRALVVQGNGKDGQPGLYRFDLQSGKASLLVANTSSPVAISPDGKTMYYAPYLPRNDTMPSQLVARDMASGRERVLYTAPRGHRLPVHSVTADGKTVIAVWSLTTGPVRQPVGVIAVSTETGAMRVLTASIPYDSMKQQARALGFTPDQRNEIVMIQGTDSTQTLSLWKVPLSGGPAVPLGHAPSALTLNGALSAGPWLSHDGTRVVYISGTLQRELWLLDDPALRGVLASRDAPR